MEGDEEKPPEEKLHQLAILAAKRTLAVLKV